jgi:hypothetical protein
MTLICLEGASSIGKSTTSKYMHKKYDAYVVEEVNKLFKRPNPEPATWYFDRQVERWSIASSQDSSLVIFDGDPFQPLWYNWCYNFEGWQSLDFLNEYYRNHIKEGNIGFPVKYYILHISDEELRVRRDHDPLLKRRNFEKHIKFIEPQTRYFEYVSSLKSNLVSFIEAKSVFNNTENIIRGLGSSVVMSFEEQLELFDYIIDWLKNNKAF